MKCSPCVTSSSSRRRRFGDRSIADPGIAGIVSTIGGDDSIRLLPYLDLDLIAANPKVFLGYSDTTVTHMALRRAGLVSFYGPAIMSGLAEKAGLHAYMSEGVRRTLFDPSAPLEWEPNRDGWTVELLDWSDTTNQERARRFEPATGWRWHGGTAADGSSVAGCLEVMDWLRGTAWWPRLDGAVLLMETSEERPPPEYVTRFLRSLAAMGELSRLAAIVFGRPGGTLTEEQRVAYDTAVLTVVRDEEGLASLRVVTNVDFGHTDPMWTIPQGVRVRVDPSAERITFLDSGVV